MAQQSIEERLASLESQVAELRILEGLRTDVQELRALFQTHQEYVSDRFNTFEEHITARLDVAEEVNAARFAELKEGQQKHEAAIESLTGYVSDLAKGQQQIISLLSGRKSERHD